MIVNASKTIALLTLMFFASAPVFAQTDQYGNPYDSTPSAEAQQVMSTVMKNKPSYNSAQQSFTMPDGSTMKMSEMSSDYSQGTINRLQSVNSGNAAAIAQSSESNMANSNSLSAQAYRTNLQAAEKTQPYVTNPQNRVHVVGNTSDPTNQPGTVSLTPSVYFIDFSKGVVVVTVTLTGGYGPAVVGYETTSSNMAPYFTPVRGQVTWGSGESGTKSFVIPVNTAALQNDRITGGTINIQLLGASGASMSTNRDGRVLIGNGNFSRG